MSVGRHLFTSSLLLVGVLPACGTDEPDTTPQSREPVAARMLAMAATAPAAPAPAFEGQLVAYQVFSTSAPPSWATFSFFDHAHSAAACLQGTTVPVVARPGAPLRCTRRDCTDADLPLGDADAGTLTITGPFGRRSLTADAGFYFLFEEGRAWSGGERISFATSGGGGPDGVPSVSTAVQAPRRARLTTPVAGRTLDRDRDLHLAWTVDRAGHDDGRFAAGFNLAVPDPVVGVRVTAIECEWDLDARAGVFPAEALGHLPAGTVDFLYVAASDADRQLGPSRVAVGATNFEADWFGSVELR